MTRLFTDNYPVMLVDDEPSVLLSTRTLLGSSGIRNVLCIEDSREVMPTLDRREVSVIVLDLFMPYISGSALLSQIRDKHPDVPVIVMTAAQAVETAVASMKEGAFDYLVKPVEESRFISAVTRAVESRSMRQQLGTLKHYLMSDGLEHREVFSSVVTQSRKMRAVFQYIEAVAPSGEPVLIMGETGVGKGVLAEAVHRVSGRAGEFVEVNVAGLDDTLFSDTLFGHKKGAFTSAELPREGLVAKATQGTLFLDEVADLSVASQVKLLRLLQDYQYYPLGSDVAMLSDVRVVCATNMDLRARMSEKQFRSDLYFRLSVHQFNVPPLRERPEDLPALVGHFVEEAAQSMGKPAPMPPPELFNLLCAYHFPGNVRELRAMTYDAVALHRKGPVLAMEAFRRSIQSEQMAEPVNLHYSHVDQAYGRTDSPGRFPTLKEAQRLHVEEALRRAGGNQGVAATLLGISRPALNRRLARLETD